MHSKRQYIIWTLNLIRCIPHLIIFFLHKNRNLIKIDIKNALKISDKKYNDIVGLIYLLSFNKSFRNVFYFRVDIFGLFLNIICPKESTLIIEADTIGEGFVISHGFSCAIGAKKIGDNFTVFQQVTIGAVGKYGCPIIGDNVTIYAGAVVFGNITIGNNVVIGANSTVFTNIPNDSTVLPGTSKIMRWKSKS